MRKSLILFACLLVLASCGDSNSTTTSGTETKATEPTSTVSELKNGITVQ